MFTSDRDGDEDFRLYLIRPDGTDLRKLTEAELTRWVDRRNFGWYCLSSALYAERGGPREALRKRLRGELAQTP